ncbi:MAG: hypothetical protein R3E83_21930 [Burkholderiaceae bacterium]
MILPADRMMRYRVAARVFPVPRAMPRLRGLMNVDGVPVPVFDVGRQEPLPMPVLAELDVLVLGDGAQAIGLTGCGAPMPLTLYGCAPGPQPDDPWRIAREAFRDEDDRLWYALSVDALTEALVSLLPPSTAPGAA